MGNVRMCGMCVMVGFCILHFDIVCMCVCVCEVQRQIASKASCAWSLCAGLPYRMGLGTRRRLAYTHKRGEKYVQKYNCTHAQKVRRYDVKWPLISISYIQYLCFSFSISPFPRSFISHLRSDNGKILSVKVPCDCSFEHTLFAVLSKITTRIEKPAVAILVEGETRQHAAFLIVLGRWGQTMTEFVPYGARLRIVSMEL